MESRLCWCDAYKAKPHEFDSVCAEFWWKNGEDCRKNRAVHVRTKAQQVQLRALRADISRETLRHQPRARARMGEMARTLERTEPVRIHILIAGQRQKKPLLTSNVSAIARNASLRSRLVRAAAIIPRQFMLVGWKFSRSA